MIVQIHKPVAYALYKLLGSRGTRGTKERVKFDIKLSILSDRTQWWRCIVAAVFEFMCISDMPVHK